MEEPSAVDEWKELNLGEREVVECAVDGTCLKLLEPSPESVELQDVDWSQAKLCTVSITCRDLQGKDVPWTKCCWSGGPGGAMTIKHTWKMLMEGMKTGLLMLKIGEAAWFRITHAGQKCEHLLRYPVLEEDIFARIHLKAVQLKVQKEPKKQDPRSDLLRILKIKEQVDKEYSRYKNTEYGLDQYNSLMNKFTGLISYAKKSDEYAGIVQEANEEIVKIKNNLGLILLRAKRHEEALKQLDFVLTHDSGNVKAMHRKGFSLEAVGSWEESLLFFKKVKDISSMNRVLDKIRSRNEMIMGHLKRKGLS